MSKMMAKKGTPSIKVCAFCKYWYDPANSALAPKRGMKDVWEYTRGIKNACSQKCNMPIMSQFSCSKFEPKI